MTGLRYMKRAYKILIGLVVFLGIFMIFRFLDNGITVHGDDLLKNLPDTLPEVSSAEIMDVTGKETDFEMTAEDVEQLYDILAEGKFQKIHEKKYNGTFSGDRVDINIPAENNHFYFIEICAYKKMTIQDFGSDNESYYEIKSEETKAKLENLFTASHK